MADNKPVTLETLYNFVRISAALVVVALVAVIVFFVADSRADRQARIENQEQVCDEIREAFHEQAILFGEFSGSEEDDPRVAEYDQRLQDELADCEEDPQ